MDELGLKWDQFVSGDEDAFVWLYKNHTSLLFEYGMRFTTDDELVKDCIQDIFFTLYKERKRIVKPRNIKAYLLASLKNGILNALRHTARSETVGDDEESVFMLVDSVEDEYIETETKEDIKKMVELVLSKLSPRQKEIIYHRYIQELSMSEICEMMGLTYQSAHNLIQKAFNKLSSDEEVKKRRSGSRP